MKNLQKNLSKQRSWPIKALTAAIVIGMTGTIVQAATVERKPIGDLEIYAPAKPGTATIFMMLDISGSMAFSSIRNDYGDGSCSMNTIEAEEIIAVVRKENGEIEETIGFKPRGCYIKGRGDVRFDRMTRLKRALIELLADEVYFGDDDDDIKETNKLKNKGSLPNDYEIGLGAYSYKSDGRTGYVIEPTKALTPEHRVALINKIKDLTANGGTPTAQAIAEAGAYMMGTNTKTRSYNNYSGFNYSTKDAKKADENSYSSPLNDSECSGNGIYLLTDGEPNGSSNNVAKAVMNQSLNGTLSVNKCNALSGDDNQAWGCTAEYAQLLRNPSNPGKLPIKTATVGFGKTFAGLTGTRDIITNGKLVKVTDCNSGNAKQDARNLCKLGERKGDDETKTFGDGGFYYTEESKDIADSIVDFAANLVQIINTAPSGTITIPDDPYRASNQLAYAYLPMLDPDIASAASIWKGNLKKYDLNQGTLFGKNKNLLYKDAAGDLSTTTQDLWQNGDFIKGGKTSNNDVEAGGVYAQLKSPGSGLSSVRTLYVEDVTSNSDSKTVLRKIGVDGSGKGTGFASLTDPANSNQLNKRRLLSFLGFDNIKTKNGNQTTLLIPGGQVSDDAMIDEITMQAPSKEIKILGGVVHSTPTAISYGATLDDNGRITDTRDDYVLFGSMDGALHMVDADTGEEEFAIIPKLMMETQPEALVEGSTTDKIGTPYFGVDAPWLVTTDYKYDLDNKRVTVDDSGDKGMFAYGGLRMGGQAFYGIDISKKTSPKMKFTITPDGLNGISSPDFKRLGQIWNKPTTAKIRLSKDDEPTNVLIFGGGYDMAYEDDEYMATTAAPAKGNAVYMIDASDGKLLWSTSSETGSSVNTKAADMIHSVTAEIAVLDRDNDGLMDHLYIADLGGQVFRADFENARPKKYGYDAVSKFSNKGVTRVLNSKPSGNPAYRFYERPIVSFYRNQSTGTNNGQLFALVNVISGNRSAPLSTLRKNNTYANRVYGIIDNDVTHADLYKSGFTAKVKDLTEGKLTNLAEKLGNAPNEAAKTAAKAAMVEGTKQGWYYPLTRFDGYNNVRYNKGVGDSVVINNLLYTTVYNPDKLYGTVSSCAAKISGGSERQLYCLPYGVCMESSSKTGTGGYLPAGQGIQELTLGSYNADNTDLTVLIGNTTIAERALEANRAGYGEDVFKNASNIKDLYPGEGSRPTQVGGDGTAGEYIFNERYTMQPRAWYERNK
ncbi:PilC/PilY family type IV pilus protein [Psychrobacter sp. DAB_AL43B]|uniref:PilC/PilY family type IV pilus protein n=1 Tax=Psychrobacter sp. DAB_AL43B TaxID=1028416 RepID=UPI0009A7D1ED|nr:PilC/PilY family type IV pilus protein [Psychrobacter sp. DAB_AL43B]SLJ83532.1 type IV pilus assembly protein PilY1 [Psychrobacter sp. DAB_AL43B]